MTTKEITIATATFEINQPYAEGHTLTAIEARVLNQTRNENVRNNTATKIKDLVAAGNLDEAKKIVAEYDAAYTFASAEASGNSVIKLSPVEREAQKIARASLTAALQAAGRKIKDIDPEKLAAKLAEIAAQDDVIKEAKSRVSKAEKLSTSLGDIGL